MRACLRSRKWWFQTLILLGFWVMVGWPLYQSHIARGLLHTCMVLVFAFSRARHFATGGHMPVVERDYLWRKTRLYALLKRLQFGAPMRGHEIATFQQETLELIASYVRSHRADWQRQEIFVNLLREDGEDIVVVARDSEHRVPGARYPKRTMVAWNVIQTGRAATVGDIQEYDSLHDPDRRYRSVLILPVYGRNGVAGAVSIDSSRGYHFDGAAPDLEKYLAPYVCLLAWTLDQEGTILAEEPA